MRPAAARSVALLLAFALGLWLCRGCGGITDFFQTQPLP